MQAVRKHAIFPPIIALAARRDITRDLDGAKADSAPIQIPIAAKFEKPQRA